MTGGIAEAFYGGVPELITEYAMSKLSKKLCTVIESFLEKY
jgi:ADP-ribosylglycohydrolase